MMAGKNTYYLCTACGHEASRWMGKCPSCGEWNTLVETEAQPAGKKQQLASALPARMSNIPAGDIQRLSCGIGELDRVLGGGIVPGSVVLLGGDPGIGKSTLLLQLADRMQQAGKNTLYVSGEESPAQIKLRAKRLNVAADPYVYCENDVQAVERQVKKLNPGLLIADSVQTLYIPEISSSPGSVTQVREATSRLTALAKQSGMAVILVGHVTKEGAIAGPKTIEHMVDTVLYFEGEKLGPYRILRSIKNRFGPAGEIGIFEMRGNGMQQVADASTVMLSSMGERAPGSAVVCSMEGTRPLLVEIQALVSTTAFGMPRRMATGFDYNRMTLLIAVLEKKAGLKLFNQDAYINVAGGIKLTEPSADLGVILSLASSFKNAPLRQDTAVMGEIGLSGEVRPVINMDRRIQECRRMGFEYCMLPKGSEKGTRG